MKKILFLVLLAACNPVSGADDPNMDGSDNSGYQGSEDFDITYLHGMYSYTGFGDGTTPNPWHPDFFKMYNSRGQSGCRDNSDTLCTGPDYLYVNDTVFTPVIIGPKSAVDPPDWLTKIGEPNVYDLEIQSSDSSVLMPFTANVDNELVAAFIGSKAGTATLRVRTCNHNKKRCTGWLYWDVEEEYYEEGRPTSLIDKSNNGKVNVLPRD